MNRASRSGGYRHYPADMARRVRFIKRAQALGFTLEEIASLLRRKLLDLAAMRAALAALVHQCNTG